MAAKFSVILKWFQQRPIAAVAIVLSVILVVVLFVRGNRLDAVLEEQTRVEAEWNRVDYNLRRARNLEADLERAQEIEAEIKSRLLNPDEVAINHDYFYQIERETGVRLITLNQGGTAEPRTVGGLPTLRQHAAISYTLSVEGGFPEVLNFLSKVAHGRYFIRVSAVNLSAATQGGSPLITANLQCQILGVRK